MAIGKDTMANVGSAVSDIFAAEAASSSAALKAHGLRIEAEGTDISAESLLLKSRGDLAEATEYDIAQGLAERNAAYTEASTRIQAAQQERQITMQIGAQRAAVAGSGGAMSGSAGDILRDSAMQGALARSVLVSQGQITEAGFEDQAKSYGVMSAAARQTAAGEVEISGKEQDIAKEQRQLAVETEDAGNEAATGDFISAAIKGASAVAMLAL